MDTFNLENRNQLPKDMVEITANYQILHFDEFPFLFSGTSKLGSRIIGSHLDEIDEKECIYTLQSLYNEKEYTDFIKRRLTYLELLQKAVLICVVEKNFNFKTLAAYQIPFNEIPEEYLPLPGSWCPQSEVTASTEFTITLKGKRADENIAEIDKVSIIQKTFADLLTKICDPLKNFIKFNTCLKGYAAGSFKIGVHMDIEHKSAQRFLFDNIKLIKEYIPSYVKYISESFLNDQDFYKKDATSIPDSFKHIIDKIKDIYGTAGIARTDRLETLLKENILKSVEKMQVLVEEIGESLDSVTIANIADDGEQHLAYFDNQQAQLFREAVENIELQGRSPETDADYRQYIIFIYHLNLDTRSGNAVMSTCASGEPAKSHALSRPKITIDGDESLVKTRYAESLYEEKWISVLAKATRVGDRYKRLDIRFEAGPDTGGCGGDETAGF